MRKTTKKQVYFDLNKSKETLMEAKKIFSKASNSGSQKKLLETSTTHKVDPLLLTTFPKTCMKLLHYKKVVEGLQELIENYAGNIKLPSEHHVVRNLDKHKK